MTTNELTHFLSKARDAASGGHGAWRVQSTGEKVAVALVLNRADWLAEMDYTIAEAIDRIGPEWAALIPTVARQLRDDDDMPATPGKEPFGGRLDDVSMQYDDHFTDLLQVPFFEAMDADPELWFIQARTIKGAQLLTFRGSHPDYSGAFVKSAMALKKEAL